VNAEPPPAPPGRKRNNDSFGVSVAADTLREIDQRVAELSKAFGFTLTRSSYFQLLSRHDMTHKLVEKIFAGSQ
jgi:hypothetical protein